MIEVDIYARNIGQSGDVPAIFSTNAKLDLVNTAYDIKVSNQVDTGGTLSMTLCNTNPYRGNIFPLTTEISVYITSHQGDSGVTQCVFRGRVTDITTNFYLEKVITCEGAIGYLEDILVKPIDPYVNAIRDYTNAYNSATISYNNKTTQYEYWYKNDYIDKEKYTLWTNNAKTLYDQQIDAATESKFKALGSITFENYLSSIVNQYHDRCHPSRTLTLGVKSDDRCWSILKDKLIYYSTLYNDQKEYYENKISSITDEINTLDSNYKAGKYERDEYSKKRTAKEAQCTKYSEALEAAKEVYKEQSKWGDEPARFPTCLTAISDTIINDRAMGIYMDYDLNEATISSAPLNVTNKKIILKRNLLDYSIDYSADGIKTVVIPVGRDASNNDVYISEFSMKGSGASKFGYIEVVEDREDIVIDEDSTTWGKQKENDLRNAGTEALNTFPTELTPVVTVKAIDMGYVKIQNEKESEYTLPPIKVGDSVTIEDNMHEIPGTFVCTRVSLDIDSFENSEYDFAIIDPMDAYWYFKNARGNTTKSTSEDKKISSILPSIEKAGGLDDTKHVQEVRVDGKDHIDAYNPKLDDGVTESPKITRVSDNEVSIEYGSEGDDNYRKIVYTADGEGDERMNFKKSVTSNKTEITDDTQDDTTDITGGN